MNFRDPVSVPPAVPGAVISIHDVRPGNRAAVEAMIADLARHGAERVSLLVMPDWHHRDRAFSNAPFCDWLRGMRDAGHELVLHGYYHEQVSIRPLGIGAGVIAKHYTAGEGEFYDIDHQTARELIARGLGEWKSALGEAPRGFIAPAWLLGKEAARALAEFDFDFTTLLTGVQDLRTSAFYPSRSLVYSVRSGWRRLCSLAWNSMVAARIDETPLARLGLHPPDWDHARIRSHALGMIRRLLETRPPTTYLGWIKATRASISPHLANP